MYWHDGGYEAFDFETSGQLPEYALQSWRVSQGKAWITSLAAIRLVDGREVVSGGLRPSLRQLVELLERAIEEKRRLVGWHVVFDIQWLLAYGLKELVFKCKWLDGMLLWKHATVEPEYDENRAKRKSYGLKRCVEELWPDQAGYEEGIDFHATTQEELERLHEYNVRDTRFTYHAAKHWWENLTNQQQAVALIEAESLPWVALANLRGVPVDTLVCRELDQHLQDTAQRNLDLLAPLGVTEKVVRSPKQLAALLFDDWKLPVVKINKKTKGRSTDKEVLYELALGVDGADPDPRVKCLREYREALNCRTKFAQAPLEAQEYNSDGCIHPQWMVFSTYCVRGDVEVLTRQGWVRLDQWPGGEIVQARPDLDLEFLPAEPYEGPIELNWVRFKQRAFDCMFTLKHTVPYLRQGDYQWTVRTAQEFLDIGEQRAIPTAGFLQLIGQWTVDQMRLFVAVQADGAYAHPRYKDKLYPPSLKFTFKKQRKVARIRQLLEACGIQFREYVCSSYADRTEIHVAAGNLPWWLGKERKYFGSWLLDTTQYGLAALIDELVHWDGSPHQDGGFKYTSSIRENVEWVVTVAALTGHKASIHAPQKGLYCCHISNQRPCKTIAHEYVSLVQEPQKSYCPQTQTGFWLARSKGHIFITGNTGRLTCASKQGKGREERPIAFALAQEKRDKMYRAILVAPEDHEIVEFDAAGQEYRWMAVASGDETMLQLCMPGEDAHTFMGASIKGWDYRETLVRHRKGDDLEVSGPHGVRMMGKVGNLSLQYRTSPSRLRSVARVEYGIPMTLPEAEHTHGTYRRIYIKVPRYWYTQIELTKRRGYVETVAGRRVQVQGDWSGRYGFAMEQTSINYRIQGTGADQKYLAIACLQGLAKELDARLAWDLHDGIYWFVPVNKVKEFAARGKAILDTLPYKKAWGFEPPINMPWDCKVGASWGSLKEFQK